MGIFKHPRLFKFLYHEPSPRMEKLEHLATRRVLASGMLARGLDTPPPSRAGCVKRIPTTKRDRPKAVSGATFEVLAAWLVA
jgi:hypothetical protein